MAVTKSKPARQATDQAIVITRVFNAPRSLVFKAWTESERMMRWFSPKGWSCPVANIDLRPGGVHHSCMRSPNGKDYWSKGVYREIVEPERLVYTDTFADKNGNTLSPQDYGMSADWPEEALIHATFNELDGKTELKLQHSPIKPGDEREMCRQGWNECLDKLADYLAEEK